MTQLKVQEITQSIVTFVNSTEIQLISAESSDPVDDAIIDFLRVSLATIFIVALGISSKSPNSLSALS